MVEIIKDCPSLEHSEILKMLMNESSKNYADCEAVILITVETLDHRCLCTITRVTKSVEQADSILEFVDRYAYEILDRIKGMFTTDTKYLFTILQYLPEQHIIRRHLQGWVATQPLQ